MEVNNKHKLWELLKAFEEGKKVMIFVDADKTYERIENESEIIFYRTVLHKMKIVEEPEKVVQDLRYDVLNLQEKLLAKGYNSLSFEVGQIAHKMMFMTPKNRNNNQ